MKILFGDGFGFAGDRNELKKFVRMPLSLISGR